ncbi:hypothetical protein NPIL_13591 [Nephila pilipes]|uniref:Uncharacterized protein n=1 Tax=Nephila pilipes TaxID=299642 RepID=A0A8X6PEU0_NEPPI|nr:hypothetical protein NPIL_13591 [Nephila pilipes]
MKKRALVEFKEYNLDEWPNINSAEELDKKIEEPESRNHASHPPFGSKKPDRHRRTENFNPESRYYEIHSSKEFEKRIPRKCFICHSPKHLCYNCHEIKKESELEKPSSFEVQTYFVVPQKRAISKRYYPW